MKKKLLLLLLIILPLGFFLFQNLRPANVITEQVIAREFAKRTVLTGELSLPNKSIIKAKIAGEISEINVNQASGVSAGDVLFKIDNSKHYQAYLNASKDVEIATREIDEYTDTYRDNLNDPEIIHGKTQLELTLEKAQNTYLVSQIGFNDYILKAPTTGKFFYSNNNILSVGQYVSLNEVIGNIYDESVVEVLAEVNQDDLELLTSFNEVEIEIDGLSNTLSAKIGQIFDSVVRNDVGDEVLIVKFDFVDEVPALFRKDGIDAKIVIKGEKISYLSVPFDAVFSEESKDYVYLVKDKKAKKHEIEIIDDFGDYVAVDPNGFSGGELVVLENINELRDGKRVTY